MIDRAFYEYIKTLTYDGSIHYGSANNASTPYFVLYKLSDDERPESLCIDQGDSGRALFQIDAFKGGQGNTSSPSDSLLYAEGLKRQIREKKGIIGSGDYQYRIWHNSTSGVVPINRGQNSIDFFGASFIVLLYWLKID